MYLFPVHFLSQLLLSFLPLIAKILTLSPLVPFTVLHDSMRCVQLPSAFKYHHSWKANLVDITQLFKYILLCQWHLLEVFASFFKTLRFIEHTKNLGFYPKCHRKPQKDFWGEGKAPNTLQYLSFNPTSLVYSSQTKVVTDWMFASPQNSYVEALHSPPHSVLVQWSGALWTRLG